MHVKMLDGFVKNNHPFLVSQTYRGLPHLFSDDAKTVILMSDYEDMTLAKVHLHALIDDKYASLIDLRTQKHYDTVKSMLLQDSKYLVFTTFIQDKKVIKKHLDDHYSANIRGYISKETNWHIGSNETIRPDLELIFGELFVILKYAGQTRKLRLADIEKY